MTNRYSKENYKSTLKCLLMWCKELESRIVFQLSKVLGNRMDPIFEKDFNKCSFGYRLARSHLGHYEEDMARNTQGKEWIVDGNF
ncbi:hypothetical protein [Clostridium sporogenes]|uniref:hypothetical protein n=2 Tax=Clostridium sporogenes TaxID=1509 RepID=UPI0013D2008B|nr:hypothetical protein [Clostridium sporogenes]